MLCWRRVQLLLFQTSWSRKELTTCTRPLISADIYKNISVQIYINVSLLTFSSSWYSKEITWVSKKLTCRYSWYILARQLYIAGTQIICKLWFYLLDSLMHVLKKFWEQVLWIPNPTFWPPWWGSFALGKVVLCPYSHGLGSDYWTRACRCFPPSETVSGFYAPIPSPILPYKLQGPKGTYFQCPPLCIKTQQCINCHDNLCSSLLCHRFLLRRKN